MGAGKVVVRVLLAGDNQGTVLHGDRNQSLFAQTKADGSLAEYAFVNVDVVVDGLPTGNRIPSHCDTYDVRHKRTVLLGEPLCKLHVVQIIRKVVLFDIGKGRRCGRGEPLVEFYEGCGNFPCSSCGPHVGDEILPLLLVAFA